MTSTMRFDKWENSLGQPYGTVLQVVQAVKTDTFATTSLTFSDVTGLSASITPRSTTSKILVTGSVNIGSNGFLTNAVFYKVVRDSTDIALGDSAATRIRGYSGAGTDQNAMTSSAFEFLDSPTSTSTLTYKLQLASNVSGQTAAVNRWVNDLDSPTRVRGVSTITLTEIAQ